MSRHVRGSRDRRSIYLGTIAAIRSRRGLTRWRRAAFPPRFAATGETLIALQLNADARSASTPRRPPTTPSRMARRRCRATRRAERATDHHADRRRHRQRTIAELGTTFSANLQPRPDRPQRSPVSTRRPFQDRRREASSSRFRGQFFAGAVTPLMRPPVKGRSPRREFGVTTSSGGTLPRVDATTASARHADTARGPPAAWLSDDTVRSDRMSTSPRACASPQTMQSHGDRRFVVTAPKPAHSHPPSAPLASRGVLRCRIRAAALQQRGTSLRRTRIGAEPTCPAADGSVRSGSTPAAARRAPVDLAPRATPRWPPATARRDPREIYATPAAVSAPRRINISTRGTIESRRSHLIAVRRHGNAPSACSSRSRPHARAVRLTGRAFHATLYQREARRRSRRTTTGTPLPPPLQGPPPPQLSAARGHVGAFALPAAQGCRPAHHAGPRSTPLRRRQQHHGRAVECMCSNY